MVSLKQSSYEVMFWRNKLFFMVSLRVADDVILWRTDPSSRWFLFVLLLPRKVQLLIWLFSSLSREHLYPFGLHALPVSCSPRLFVWRARSRGARKQPDRAVESVHRARECFYLASKLCTIERCWFVDATPAGHGGFGGEMAIQFFLSWELCTYGYWSLNSLQCKVCCMWQ